jgi:hypothetical protein
MRLGFRIGPFYLSQRLGRTQAQKRAAVKQRAEARGSGTMPGGWPRRGAGGDRRRARPD